MAPQKRLAEKSLFPAYQTPTPGPVPVNWFLTLFLTQLATALFMTGLIWFVQIVHYPLFSRVGTEQFSLYEAAHARLTTFVVMPTMLIELVTAVALVFVVRPPVVQGWLLGVALGLLVVVWLSTFAIQVPLHGKLERGFDERSHWLLVQTNWIRSVAWTGRSLLLLYILYLILERNTSIHSGGTV